MMRRRFRLWLLSTAAFAACVHGDEFRGTDRSALLPAARARWSWRPPPAPAPAAAPRVAFRPAFEGAVDHVEGDFAQGSRRPDYRATSMHAAFAPELSWRSVRASPIVGLAYGEVRITDGAARAEEEGLGFALGAEAVYRGWSACEPYVRYVGKFGGDWSIGRFEVGLELGVTRGLGLQVAYARQTNRTDEVFGFPDDSRIATEGVHVGLSLRF